MTSGMTSELTNVYGGRHVLIFAATGAVARATALALADQGAKLYLSARNLLKLREVSDWIYDETGACANLAQVDACDPMAVASYLDRLSNQGVRPDWTFNGLGLDPTQAQYGQPADALSLQTFTAPMLRIVGSQWLTSVAVAQRMRAAGSGTVVLLTSGLARTAMPFMAGITAASDAVQGLARVLAAEYQPHKLRVHCIRLAGIADTPTIQQSHAAIAQTRAARELALHDHDGDADHAPRSASKASSIDTPGSLTLRAAALSILAATAPNLPMTHGAPIDVEAA